MISISFYHTGINRRYIIPVFTNPKRVHTTNKTNPSESYSLRFVTYASDKTDAMKNTLSYFKTQNCI